MDSFTFEDGKGHKYKVLFKKLPPRCSYMGLCEDPEDESPKIVINSKLKGKGLMNTLIHEFAHAFFWESTEKNVTIFANKITKILYQMGWRHEKTKTKKNKRTNSKNSREVLSGLQIQRRKCRSERARHK